LSTEAHASSLAAALAPLRPGAASARHVVDAGALARFLRATTLAFQTTRSESPAFQKSAEWFLDNRHLVARTIRQLTTELPAGFRRRLPRATGDDAPRVLRLARALVDAHALDLDEAALVAFVRAFQATAPLRIAELWALPAMLRLATIEAL